MSKPQTVTGSSCVRTEAVENQVFVNETSVPTDGSKHVPGGKVQGKKKEQSSKMTQHCRTMNKSQITRRTNPRTTTPRAAPSSADFIPFSLYSHLLQGRQPPRPFHMGAPCYVRHARVPSASLVSGRPVQPFPAPWTGPPPLSSRVAPNLGARCYTSHSATQNAKPVAYEIDPCEDIGNVNRDPCDREDPRLTVDSMIPRRWEYTAFGRSHQAQPRSGVELTVLSYNVLSQRLLEDNSFLYPHCYDDALDWNKRKTRIMDELVSCQPDVMCLQEIQADHYTDYFLPKLSSAGYEGVYQKRTGDKPDGCAVFVNRRKLAIAQAFPVLYNRGDILNRDNIALIVHLRSKNASAKRQADVFIATTHLLFNPKRGDIKLAQLSVLMAELDRLAHKGTVSGGFPGYAPVILCGDFNAEPHSDIYKFVIRGYLKYEGLLCRQLSGQREKHFGRDVYLSNQLLSPKLGITDQCQYVRNLHVRNIPIPEDIWAACVGSDGPDRPDNREVCACSPSPVDSTGPPWRMHSAVRPGHRNVPKVSQGLGCLWHNLNFVSAYNHTIERLGHSRNEITTQHEHASCTLDYIFYNVRRKRTHTQRNRVRLQNVEEDKLCLIGRYGLLSAQEIHDLGGLPNKYLGSDHLALLAKFLLKYS
ncbi:protein angel homolog 2-like isoform X2 [Liolophura sinensis]